MWQSECLWSNKMWTQLKFIRYDVFFFSTKEPIAECHPYAIIIKSHHPNGGAHHQFKLKMKKKTHSQTHFTFETRKKCIKHPFQFSLDMQFNHDDLRDREGVCKSPKCGAHRKVQ